MVKLFNPDYLRSLCYKYGLQPSKKYGQNFLINEEPVAKIIEAAGIKKTDTVVEIGPGFGVLTFALAAKAKKVLAFEIEKKLENYWQEKAPENVEIIWGNVLKANCELRTANCELPYKVVANLPYQITSPVIRTFLEADNPPATMTLMVQKEVAERICAEPGDMSVLAVSVQYYAQPEIIVIVPRANFWPEPKVDSAVIKIVRSSQFAVHSAPEKEKFFKMVKAGFANRRKLLIKNLLPVIGKQNRGTLERAFTDLGLPKTARAQELSVEEWKALAELI
ncbi:MAG: 16S rRNA (adenine(1518)-N(6)/adenine(1519)-N(6))-dimethyltransferase RsmA [Patescibacteria group bacterium]|nr:16S rRNA (adenine(1518)-N(6)/adenine(1519)-N(6))-dimethyltransferase RsmA [Patescibacteria group bacterium]